MTTAGLLLLTYFSGAILGLILGVWGQHYWCTHKQIKINKEILKANKEMPKDNKEMSKDNKEMSKDK